MPITAKRIIYSVFFLLFLAITPGVILYSSGIRYNFKKERFQNTGVIFVESKPDDARIWVNGESTEYVTPARIGDLQPNIYDIVIAKTGYQTWENTVNVYANTTSFIRNVHLFRKYIEPVKVAGPILRFLSISPQRDYIAWIDPTEKFVIYDINNGFSPSFILDGHADHVAWSFSGRFVAVWDDTEEGWGVMLDQANRTTRVIDIKSAPLILEMSNNLTRPHSVITSVAFDPMIEEVAYVGSVRGLFRVNAITESTERLVDAKVFAVFSERQALFAIIEERGGGKALVRYTQNGGLMQTQIISMPDAPQYDFVPSPPGSVAIKANNKLFIVMDPQNARPRLYSFLNVSDARLSGDGKKILTKNDYELNVIYFEDDANGVVRPVSETVARLSEEITAFEWNTESSHIFFAQHALLRVVELFKARQRNAFDLVTFLKVESIIYTPKIQEVLVTARAGQDLNLYRLEIQ